MMQSLNSASGSKAAYNIARFVALVLVSAAFAVFGCPSELEVRGGTITDDAAALPSVRYVWEIREFETYFELLDLKQTINEECAECVRLNHPGRQCKFQATIGTMPVMGDIPIEEEELEGIRRYLTNALKSCNVKLTTFPMKRKGTITAYVVAKGAQQRKDDERPSIDPEPPS